MVESMKTKFRKVFIVIAKLWYCAVVDVVPKYCYKIESTVVELYFVPENGAKLMIWFKMCIFKVPVNGELVRILFLG